MHGTAFPKGSPSLGKSRNGLFHSCYAVKSESHWPRSSVLDLELHSLCLVRAQKLLFSSALFCLPICSYFLEKEESAVA